MAEMENISLNNSIIFKELEEKLENSENQLRTLLDQLLRKIFWSRDEMDHLISPELYQEFIDLVLNPIYSEVYDIPMLDYEKVEKLTNKIRQSLRDKKDLI